MLRAWQKISLTSFDLKPKGGDYKMGTVPAQKLLDKWSLDDLTHDQAIGHLLQHLVMLHDNNKSAASSHITIENAITAIDINLSSLRADVDRALQLLGLSDGTPPSRKRGRPRKSK